MDHFFSPAYVLSPFLVIYTLVALLILCRRRCPIWIKTLEIALSLLVLIPLAICGVHVLVICVLWLCGARLSAG